MTIKRMPNGTLFLDLNDIKNLDENGLFTAKNWKPLESGLIGTVKLIGLSSKK